MVQLQGEPMKCALQQDECVAVFFVGGVPYLGFSKDALTYTLTAPTVGRVRTKDGAAYCSHCGARIVVRHMEIQVVNCIPSGSGTMLHEWTSTFAQVPYQRCRFCADEPDMSHVVLLNTSKYATEHSYRHIAQPQLHEWPEVQSLDTMLTSTKTP